MREKLQAETWKEEELSAKLALDGKNVCGRMFNALGRRPGAADLNS
jgi:hypothetical protein